MWPPSLRHRRASNPPEAQEAAAASFTADAGGADVAEAVDVCRLCLAGKEDGEFLAPCSCSGTHQYVHRACLSSWLDALAARGGDTTRCELCRQPYTAPVQAMVQGRCRRRRGLLLVEVLLLVVVVAYLPDGMQDWIESGLTALLAGRSVAALHPGVALCFRAGSSLSAGPFAESVVLLTSYSSLGALGYIINKPLRPSDEDIEALRGSDPRLLPFLEQSLEPGMGTQVGYGGPVTKSWQVIRFDVSDYEALGGRSAGLEGVSLGVWSVASQVARRPSKHRQEYVVRGYAGWAPMQLDGEVRRGAWSVHTVTSELLAQTPAEDLYSTLLALPREEEV